MEKPIIIYGIGGLSELVTIFLEKESSYKICGYCIENEHRNNLESFNGRPLINFTDLKDSFPPSDYSLFIAVGNNYTRERIFTESKKKGYSMISHINKSVLHWDDLR